MSTSRAAEIALDVEALGMRFGAVRAIEDVSLRIAQGEQHVLLGTNGAGKTTLFNTITGDLRATAGRIRFFGRDITHLPSWARLRMGIARTYQSSQLFNGLTVADSRYIALRGCLAGRLSLRREKAGAPLWQRAQAIAAQVGLHELEHRDVGTLSHGQQRQLEVGMILASEPHVLLLDESAAGLSPPERQVLIALIEALPADLTIGLIEHDMDVALRLAHQVTTTKNGRIVVQGTPDDIRASDNVRKIYFGEALEEDTA